MGQDAAASYLAEALRALRQYKALADDAIAQVGPDRLFERLGPEANSVAALMRHLGGNMRSRWTDFLTTDGEKRDRNRDAEFEPDPAMAEAELRARWEEGWRCLFAALEGLGPADLLREVRIRGNFLTALEAINRQLAHYAYHIGQIVLLAKHARGADWRPLSEPTRRSR